MGGFILKRILKKTTAVILSAMILTGGTGGVLTSLPQIANSIVHAETTSPDISTQTDDYTTQHSTYFRTGNFKKDIVTLQSSPIQGLLEDIKNNLTDKLYGYLDSAVKVLDIGSYYNFDLKDGFSMKYPLTLENEYSAILYELMASDTVYNSQVKSFSVSYHKKLLSNTKKLINKLTGFVKNDYSKKTDDIKKKFTAAFKAVEVLEPGDDGYDAAWKKISELCNQYLDVKKSKKAFSEFCSALGDGFSILGDGLTELSYVSNMLQYISYGETYLRCSKEFEQMLEDMANYARQKADLEKFLGKYSPTPQYEDLYLAISNWTKKMNAYREDALKATITQFASDNVKYFAVDKMVNWAANRLIPGIGAIRTALASGKSVVDGISWIYVKSTGDSNAKTIKEDNANASVIKAAETIGNVIVDLSNIYGNAMTLGNNSGYGKVGADITKRAKNLNNKEAWDEMVRMFDKSIFIYKQTMEITCIYGEKYEKSILAKAKKQTNDISAIPIFGVHIANFSAQKQASLSSTLLSTIAAERLFLNDIHCHEEEKPSIKLNTSKVTLYKGKSKELTAKTTGVSKGIAWESSNKNIATVSSNGKVTAKKPVQQQLLQRLTVFLLSVLLL